MSQFEPRQTLILEGGEELCPVSDLEIICDVNTYHVAYKKDWRTIKGIIVDESSNSNSNELWLDCKINNVKVGSVHKHEDKLYFYSSETSMNVPSIHYVKYYPSTIKIKLYNWKHVNAATTFPLHTYKDYVQFTIDHIAKTNNISDLCDIASVYNAFETFLRKRNVNENEFDSKKQSLAKYLSEYFIKRKKQKVYEKMVLF
jgi:hypothetical protein